MAIAVLLNRMFQWNTIHYLNIFINKKEDIDACYFIIPEEDMSSASDLKAQFYRGILQRFYQSFAQKSFTPYVMSYDDMISFVKKTISLK